MRILFMTVVGALAALTATPALATCVGTNVRTCMDGNGNTYTTTRFSNGNSMTTGSNARTGSTWSQQTFGNQTFGTDSRGRSWNSTTTRAGTFGTDADGNMFYSPN